jgi:hypothetical protein
MKRSTTGVAIEVSQLFLICLVWQRIAVPERIDRIDDRPLLVTDHPHFPESDPERGQIFRDIADVLFLGAARQDFVADHQEGGDLFRSGCVGGCHHRLVVHDRTHSKPQLPPLSALTPPWVTLCLHGKS